MSTSVSLSILSGIFITGEIVTYEYITKKHPELNKDALVWIYRLGSVLFISLYMLYKTRNADYKVSLKQSMTNSSLSGWFLLLSLLSTISILLFFKSLDMTEGSKGIPVTIRSIYIPLTFAASIMFVNRGNWSRYTWRTYVGMFGIVASVMMIIWGHSVIA